MNQNVLDRAAIDGFLEAAANELEGEWVVLGGSAAAVWFLPARVTEDIDIVGLGGTREERAALMDLADARGLSVESVNSAADYFLRKVEGWRDELEILRQAKATIYRPTPTLFVLLKIGRLTESDLGDCLALVEACKENAWTLERARILTALAKLPVTSDTALATRREDLRARLGVSGG